MKILMIAPQPFLVPRGTPISVYQRLCALSSLGHEVDLLTYHVGEDVDIPGVKIHRIPRIPWIKEVKAGPSWRKLFLDVFIVWKAIVMLSRRRYDVIHSHEEAAFFSIPLSVLFRTHHLYDMHSRLPRQLENFNFGNVPPIIKLFEILERWTLRTCDGVLTIDGDLGEYVKGVNPSVNYTRVENLPIQTEFMPIAEKSVDELRDRFGLNGRLAVVYTGSFERYQGLDLLVDSVESVKEKHPGVVFLLVGGRPRQIEYWKNEVRRRNLEEWIRFVGTVPVEEIPLYVGLAEILVSPRIFGTSVPLKIYTYLLSGKPIVATRIPSHTQVLNNEVAVLVKPTKEDLAEGISRLIQTPDLRTQVGRQAHNFAMEYCDPAKYSTRLDQAYQAFQRSSQSLVEHSKSVQN
ncbi:MAG: glycosyltransferase [Anaerolineales bacterium]|nr:glycosyltransferase [Anaerolineales bacterium]